MEELIKIQFPFYHEGEQKEWKERMWAAPSGEYYEIRNIPIYVKEFAFLDIVSTISVEGELFVDELIKESGHSTIRIVFHDMSLSKNIIEDLKASGCEVTSSDKEFLVALDVPPNIDYWGKIQPFLEAQEALSVLGYEEACISSIHSE